MLDEKDGVAMTVIHIPDDQAAAKGFTLEDWIQKLRLIRRLG